MTLPAIHIRDLRKTYVVSLQEAGAKAALKDLVHRRTQEVRAVALAAVLLLVSRGFWRLGLRRYSGTSA